MNPLTKRIIDNCFRELTEYQKMRGAIAKNGSINSDMLLSKERHILTRILNFLFANSTASLDPMSLRNALEEQLLTMPYAWRSFFGLDCIRTRINKILELPSFQPMAIMQEQQSYLHAELLGLQQELRSSQQENQLLSMQYQALLSALQTDEAQHTAASSNNHTSQHLAKLQQHAAEQAEQIQRLTLDNTNLQAENASLQAQLAQLKQQLIIYGDENYSQSRANKEKFFIPKPSSSHGPDLNAEFEEQMLACSSLRSIS